MANHACSGQRLCRSRIGRDEPIIILVGDGVLPEPPLPLTLTLGNSICSQKELNEIKMNYKGQTTRILAIMAIFLTIT